MQYQVRRLYVRNIRRIEIWKEKVRDITDTILLGLKFGARRVSKFKNVDVIIIR